MKPIIGLTMTKKNGKLALNEPYVNSVIDAGGLPICIPFGVERDAEQIVESIDGLLLTGGVDLHPNYYGEDPHPKLGEVILARDKVELELLHVALKKKLPIFAICRGIQMLNVALGGTLFQDIDSQIEGEVLIHNQSGERDEASHEVEIEKDSQLFQLMGKTKISVNSFHHQSLKDVPDSLAIVAKSSDGIIEAVELKDYPFCIAVQWHPEEMAVTGETSSKSLFQAFIQTASEVK